MKAMDIIDRLDGLEGTSTAQSRSCGGCRYWTGKIYEEVLPEGRRAKGLHGVRSTAMRSC